jgi:tRNA G10  N-methylase Trm11
LLNSQSEKKLVLSQVRTTAAYFEKLWRPDNSSISTAFTNDCTKLGIYEQSFLKLAAENPGMKDAEIMAKVRQMWAASKQNAANNAAEVKKSKRSLGAYKIFYEEVRPKIVAAHPKFTIGEVREKVGEKWKKLSDAERKSYGVRFTASERGR